MDVQELEALDLPPGDIVLHVTQEWARREEATVARFCEASLKLGNTRVQEIFSLLEQAEVEWQLPRFERDSSKNSQSVVI